MIPVFSTASATPRIATLAASLMLLSQCVSGCVDDTLRDASGHKGAAAVTAERLLVVATDYGSTSLSWVDPATMTVSSAGFLHSGTAVSAAGAALSGDVVLGSEGLPDGQFPVLDRSHSSVLWVGGETISQWPLSDGFQANPQDVWRHGDEIAVVRSQRDPTPTDSLLSGGDDVLLLNFDGAPLARVPLDGEATLPGGVAFAGRGVRLGDRLWLPLASFSKDFSAIGAGRLVEVDLTQRTVAQHLAVPTLRNCTTLQSSSGVLMGTCSGFFQESETQQALHSGVFRLDPATAEVKVVLTGDAIGGVVGFPVAVDGSRRAWIVRLGRLNNPPRPDEVWRLDPNGVDPPALVWQGSRGFAIGGIWYDASRRRLWVSDAGDAAGDLVVLDVGAPGSAMTLAARLRTQLGGLPAVHLAHRPAP